MGGLIQYRGRGHTQKPSQGASVERMITGVDQNNTEQLKDLQDGDFVVQSSASQMSQKEDQLPNLSE